MESIYLDHNATTPTRPEVADLLTRAYAGGYANPASQHRPGQRAQRALNDARERIAELLGADLTCPRPDRLVFTASGTESNNLALLGIAQAKSKARDQIIISSIEHQSVIEPAEHLLEQGWRLDTLTADRDGTIRVDALPQLLRPDARLVSVMHANHETGVLQPIAELARHCNDCGIALHTDAVQSVGKLPIDFRTMGVAAMSVAAHKFGGPLGIGALLLRHDVVLKPLIYGGNQQHGLRPGTECIPLVFGMRAALELACKEQEKYICRVTGLRKRFEDGLRAGFPEIVIHGESAPRLPNTSNIAFPGVAGQILLIALDTNGVACSAGSACSSGSTELSPTLRAMGLPSDLVASSLRFSLGATTTEAEIDEAVARIVRVCNEIRGST
jgi:cysteine desulfurase